MISNPLSNVDISNLEKQLLNANIIGEGSSNKEVARIISELIASHRLLKIRYDVKTEKIIKILGE